MVNNLSIIQVSVVAYFRLGYLYLKFVNFLFVIGEESEPPTHQITKKMMHNEERRAIFLTLQTNSVHGKLKKGTIKNIAEMYSVSPRTISPI